MRLPLAASTLAIALALAACSPQPEGAATPAAATQQAEDQSARLNAWFDQQYEEFLQFSPTTLTFQGRKDRYDELDDMSEAAMRERLDWLADSVAEMESSFDYDSLDPDAQLSWEIWKRQLDSAQAQWEFRAHRYAFDQMNGMNSVLPMFMINFHKVDNEQDYLAYVSRLEAFDTVLDQLLEYGRQSAELGIRAPRFAYEGVIEQSRNIITGAPFQDGSASPLWADLQAKADALVEAGEISQERADELKQQARDALTGHVLPVYERIIAWAESELPHALENPAGVGTTHPGGSDYYAWQLRENTTTDMTADEIHQLGLDEVARLRGEMDALLAGQGLREGSVAERVAALTRAPKHRYADTDAGRAELAGREGDLAGIEAGLSDSVRLIASEVRQSVQDAMKSLRADLAAAANDERTAAKARPSTAAPMSDERITSREQLHRADAAVNSFRARVRTDLRTHVARGGALAEQVVTDLENALDAAAHAVTRALGSPDR